MADLVDRDLEHLRLLEWAHYLMAGMSALYSLFALFPIGMGFLFASGVIPAARHPTAGNDAWIGGLVFVCLGAAMLVFGLTAAVLLFLVARSLRTRRRRVFCLVIAVLICFQVPWGTALGVCTFLVLNRPGVKAMFERAQPNPERAV